MISPNMVVDGLTWREVTWPGTGKQQLLKINPCILSNQIYTIDVS